MSPFGLSTSLCTSLDYVSAGVRLIVKKMLKVRRKKKKKRKERKKKHTNSIARIIEARASSPAVISFARLKLYQATKETKYKIPSISKY